MFANSFSSPTATCNGKFSSVNSTKGGHCNGTESGGFLKIEMHVCQDGGKMIKNFFVVKFNIQFLAQIHLRMKGKSLSSDLSQDKGV